MGPAILARALDDVPYAVKIHGSALEYTVKRDPERFLPFAREGLGAARGGARRVAAHRGEPLAALGDPELRAAHPARPARRRRRAVRARATPAGGRGGLRRLAERAAHASRAPRRGSDAFATDPAAAASALARSTRSGTGSSSSSAS